MFVNKEKCVLPTIVTVAANLLAAEHMIHIQNKFLIFFDSLRIRYLLIVLENVIRLIFMEDNHFFVIMTGENNNKRRKLNLPSRKMCKNLNDGKCQNIEHCEQKLSLCILIKTYLS